MTAQNIGLPGAVGIPDPRCLVFGCGDDALSIIAERHTIKRARQANLWAVSGSGRRSDKAPQYFLYFQAGVFQRWLTLPEQGWSIGEDPAVKQVWYI